MSTRLLIFYIETIFVIFCCCCWFETWVSVKIWICLLAFRWNLLINFLCVTCKFVSTYCGLKPLGRWIFSVAATWEKFKSCFDGEREKTLVVTVFAYNYIIQLLGLRCENCMWCPLYFYNYIQNVRNLLCNVLWCFFSIKKLRRNSVFHQLTALVCVADVEVAPMMVQVAPEMCALVFHYDFQPVVAAKIVDDDAVLDLGCT